MDHMSRKLTALLGIVSVAALGIYLKLRGSHRTSSSILKTNDSTSAGAQRIDVDDDAAAEIIKRAKPALERARRLYAW